MIRDHIRRSVFTPWVGLVAPAVAWAIHHRVASDLVFYDCRLGDVATIAALGGVMGLISAASGLISWASRPVTSTREMRTYVAYLGTMAGAVFCLAMAGQTLATLMLAPVSSMTVAWSIIVHGGAGAIRSGREARKRDGMMAALAAGQAVLRSGGPAAAAVEAAIRVMEDDPVFNAGFGSVLTSAGRVENDAAIMDGATLDAGAVAALSGVRNPISVARALMAEPTVMLAGPGAQAFATSHGGLLVDPREMIAPERADEAKDTVGCVAYDRAGNLAAGTSTGGISKKPPGRVGDSPIVGAGLYAENDVGGCAYSGDGEAILRLSLATRLICDMAQQDAAAAADRSIALMDRVGGEAGVIVLGPAGQLAFAHNSPQFAVGVAGDGRSPQVCLARNEWDGR